MPARGCSARTRGRISTETATVTTTRPRAAPSPAATGLLARHPVLLELAPERGAADAERLGGAGLVAAEPLQRLEDVDALGVGETDLPRKRRRGTQLEPRRHMRRQILRTDGVASSQDGRALDRILQLAHVPRPWVAEEAFEGLGGQAEPAVELARRPREEMLGQRGNVLAAVAKGRERHLDDVETIEKVFTEASLADQRREVAVGGGDHTHVDGRGLRRAEPPDLAALQRAEELYLKNAGHLGDLVQEQRAAVGLFEEAELVDGGAGEGAPHVAEELGLEQRLGHRAAVHGHERARRARARVVDRLGDDLLVSPGLALDQERGVGRRDALHEVQDRLHGRGLRDQPREAVALPELGAQVLVLAAQRATGQRLVDAVIE